MKHFQRNLWSISLDVKITRKKKIKNNFNSFSTAKTKLIRFPSINVF